MKKIDYLNYLVVVDNLYEYGENQYGSYCKWQNGILECWINEKNISINNYSILQLPHNFISTPNIKIGCQNGINNCIPGSIFVRFQSSDTYDSLSSIKVTAIPLDQTNTIDAKVSIYVKGKWK